MIKDTIINDCIKANFDNGNGGLKTEIHQEMFLKVSVCKLNKDTLEKYATEFSMDYYQRGLVCISDFSPRLLLLPE